jgi:DNA repair photolyase
MPQITSQISVCPVPFKFDPYTGCNHGCRYCFAKQLVEFSRRKREENGMFASVEVVNLKPFINFWKKIETSEKPESVFARERVPLKIGGFSDPFPTIEKETKNTYQVLKILDDMDYPVTILTKNPAGLVDIASAFSNPNWSIGVSICTMNDKIQSGIEPNAPTTKQRLEAIRTLTGIGLNVMVKIQPAIYPMILNELDQMTAAFKEAGAWAFNTEGLKVRVSPFPDQKAYFDQINGFVGLNVREFYKKNGLKEGIHYALKHVLKMEYINRCIVASKENKIKYFVADNGMGDLGDGPECCGTEVLRDYRLWGGCDRIGFWNDYSKCSDKLYGLKIKTNSFSNKTKVLRRANTDLSSFGVK